MQVYFLPQPLGRETPADETYGPAGEQERVLCLQSMLLLSQVREHRPQAGEHHAEDEVGDGV